MLIVIAIMTLGMIIGYILRTRKKLLQISGKLTIWIIFLLLFFMGISVGSNSEVMNHLDTIGLRGLQLALITIAGSVTLSWIVFIFFFKQKNEAHER